MILLMSNLIVIYPCLFLISENESCATNIYYKCLDIEQKPFERVK